MPPKQPSKEFLKRLKAVTAKRPKVVIDHILKHGFVTTEELRTQYGYGHPPRAAKDARDQGIPLQTTFVKGSDGRRIAAYQFADLSKIRRGFLGGRQAFSKKFKSLLVKATGDRCQICLHEFEDRYLQIDHRIPYEVSGDVAFDERDTDAYMPVCGSCNRAKSWSCEHCLNWTDTREERTCRSCYWASPEQYTHIAMQDARRLDLTWIGDETKVYDTLHKTASLAKEPMPEHVKKILRQITIKENR